MLIDIGFDIQYDYFDVEPVHPNHRIQKVYKEKLTKTPFSHEKRAIRYTHSRKFYAVSLVPKYTYTYIREETCVYLYEGFLLGYYGESMPLLIPCLNFMIPTNPFSVLQFLYIGSKLKEKH